MSTEDLENQNKEWPREAQDLEEAQCRTLRGVVHGHTWFSFSMYHKIEKGIIAAAFPVGFNSELESTESSEFSCLSQEVPWKPLNIVVVLRYLFSVLQAVGYES